MAATRGWLDGIRERYRRVVGLDRRPDRSFTVLRRSPALDRYVGQWVAIKGNEIIAFADSSSALARRLRELGDRARGATAQFVPTPIGGYKVGVG